MTFSAQVLLSLLLVLVAITAAATVRMRNLFAATILMGIYSLLMALTWTIMDAGDVAFTEAAVGAGISTILLIGALVHTGSKERRAPRLSLPAFGASALTGVALLYGTGDMPRLGRRDAPVHRRAASFYMSEASRELTHAPNMVTPILASYRGFDTMFETAVIFVAGTAMILLLRRPGTDAPSATRDAGADADGGDGAGGGGRA